MDKLVLNFFTLKKVQCIKDKQAFFAVLLHDSMKGAGTKESMLLFDCGYFLWINNDNLFPSHRCFNKNCSQSMWNWYGSN